MHDFSYSLCTGAWYSSIQSGDLGGAAADAGGGVVGAAKEADGQLHHFAADHWLVAAEPARGHVPTADGHARGQPHQGKPAVVARRRPESRLIIHGSGGDHQSSKHKHRRCCTGGSSQLHVANNQCHF
jgi:hypothetical protein